MNRTLRLAACLLALTALTPPSVGLAQPAAAAAEVSAQDLAAIQRIDQDVRLAGVLDRVRAAGKSGVVAFTGVSVIDPVKGEAVPGQTVIVRGERIAWVGPAGEAPSLRGATVIDGRGRFLSPGLVDSHVHTQGLGEQVLRLAAGVTTVRDMDGFPWMLRMREAIAEGRMIGASDVVVGTIIADRPLEGYAVVGMTSGDLRRIVRAQKACGYSAIKVHNNLALWRFDVVADEARKQGLDLVGHVPHFLSVDHAVHANGMRTLEHLKGFLFDQNLKPSTEDYGEALAGALDRVWITPTFYTQRDLARGEAAAAYLADPRMRFVPRAQRESWADFPKQGGDERDQLGRTFLDTQGKVAARLVPLKPRWLAGTDLAGYAFNVAGFGLHDELELMAGFGIPTADVVRAATSEPAIAFRQEAEFGQVKAGMRADLVLLDANPLEDVEAYRRNAGVMARGRWYSPKALDAALDRLAALYAEPALSGLDAGRARGLSAAVARLDGAGVVLETQALIPAAAALRKAGHAAEADALVKAAAVPADGPFAAEYPT